MKMTANPIIELCANGSHTTLFNITEQTMNTLSLNVSTDGESPRGWQQYMLLQSPKAGFLSKSKLPFIILFFGAGLLVGATWSKHGLEAAPRDSAMAKRKHLLTSTADTYDDVDETTDTNHLRGHGTDGHFPLAWLMSFPVSNAYISNSALNLYYYFDATYIICFAYKISTNQLQLHCIIRTQARHTRVI